MSDIILARVSQTLATEQSLESLVRQLLEMLELVTNMESTYLTKIDTQAQLQHIVYSRNSGEMNIPENLSVPWGDTLCKRAMDDNCFYSDHVAEQWSDCDAAKALGITTFLSTPIHLTDGSLYGTLCATSTQQKSLSFNSEHVLQLFASIIARYIEKESLVSQLQEANAALIYHSYTDALTGLPNRRAIFDNLEMLFSLARHLNHAVLLAFIDLDNFKKINDLYGHQAGDAFLQQVGQRLKLGISADDQLGRLGGDEFMVATLSRTAVQLEQFTETLRHLLIGDYLLGDTLIHYPGASIGTVIIDPNKMNPDSALRAADSAMYQDKKFRHRTEISAQRVG